MHSPFCLIYSILRTIQLNITRIAWKQAPLFWKFYFPKVQLLATWNEVSIHTNAQCL